METEKDKLMEAVLNNLEKWEMLTKRIVVTFS